MPIFLLIVGAVFLLAAVRGTHQRLGSLLQTQFTGPQSFTAWAIPFILLALLGTIEPLRPVARAMMVLMMIVLILYHSRNGSILTLISQQLLNTTDTGGTRLYSGKTIKPIDLDILNKD